MIRQAVRTSPAFPGRRLLTAVLLTAAAALSSCTGLPQGWSEARRGTLSDPVSGAWAGHWHSESTGHRGGLRCVISPVKHCVPLPREQEMRHFRFRASWAKILCAGFTMDGAAVPAGKDGHTISGSRDLGPLFGGVFTCRGTIRGDAFSARYEAKVDRGTMEMRRVR